jgi:hypothetical protein
MCVRSNKHESDGENKEKPIEKVAQKPLASRKSRASAERMIERVLLDSKKADWSYIDFAVHVLEVLAVLRHRNKVMRESEPRETPQ